MRRALLLGLIVCASACGRAAGQAAPGELGRPGQATAGPAREERAVVLATAPLALENPQRAPVTRPVWGSAFTLARPVAIRLTASAEGPGSGLLFSDGRSVEPSASELRDPSTELELAHGAAGWTLRERRGLDVVQERRLGVRGEAALTVHFDAEGDRASVRGGFGSISLELERPLGPAAGVYVRLEPGAALRLRDLAVLAPLAGASAGRAPVATPHPTLRSRSRGRVTVGTATDVWPPRTDARFEALLGDQFEALALTELYWSTTRGEDEDYFFLPADLMANHASVHGQKVDGYFLVWDFELPAWLRALAERGDAGALGRALDAHIDAVVGRYAGRVRAWVVVNEAVWGPDESPDRRAGWARSLWRDALGPGFVARAFRRARAADPSAALLYNETGAEALGPKSDFVFAMVRGLQGEGVPIDGVGLQFHLNAARLPSFADVRANLERFAALGLDVYVTELDVSLADLKGKLAPAEQERVQAGAYEAVVEACLSVSKCRALTVFGVSDLHAWDELGDASPLLFDDAYRPKPAFFAFREALARGAR